MLMVEPVVLRDVRCDRVKMFQLVCANRRSIPYTYVISNNIGIVAALLLLATGPIAEGFPQASSEKVQDQAKT